MASETAAAMLGLLDRIRIVQDAGQEQALVDSLVATDRPLILSFVNQHGFNLAWSDAAFRAALSASDVILRDGVGMEVCFKLLGRPAGRNLNGTDFIPRLLRAAEGRSVAVFGTKDPWLSAATDKLRGQGGRVVAQLDGFQAAGAYAEAARDRGPELILLGMGMPRQEMLALDLKRQSARPCLIVNGGAVVDFLGERFPRAPLLLQRLRMEWLFRLLQEPQRLAKRYLGGGLSFLLRVMALRKSSGAMR